MKTKELAAVTSLFCLTTAILYHSMFDPDKIIVTTGLIQSDLLNQNLPFHWLYGTLLRSGVLLKWTDLIGNGFPILGTGQSGGLYPVNFVLFRLLSPLAAFNATTLIHLVILAIGVYLYARTIEISRSGSFISALAITYSGFTTIHLMHTSMIQVVAFIPYSLLVIEYLLKKNRVLAGLLGLGIIWSLQALAGHLEILFFLHHHSTYLSDNTNSPV